MTAVEGCRLIFYEKRELSDAWELRAQGGRVAYIHRYKDQQEYGQDLTKLEDSGAIEVSGEITDEMVFI